MEVRPILFVEDNAQEALLIGKALEKSGLSNGFVHVKDGQEALLYLFGAGGAVLSLDRMPAVVLIDLDLPRMDGLELLRRMRIDYRTKLVPVVIFTGSNGEQDLINGYSLGANSYIRKPVQSEEFSLAVEHMVTYWTRWNEPPPPGERIWAHHFDPFSKPA